MWSWFNNLLSVEGRHNKEAVSPLWDAKVGCVQNQGDCLIPKRAEAFPDCFEESALFRHTNAGYILENYPIR